MENIKIQPLSHGKHLIPLFHTNQLILFKEIITVCFQNRNENKYTMWEKLVVYIVATRLTYLLTYLLHGAESFLRR